MAAAGYSGTPLLQKLGLKSGQRVWLLHRVDIKVCAVSDSWSGLKLVVPLNKR